MLYSVCSAAGINSVSPSFIRPIPDECQPAAGDGGSETEHQQTEQRGTVIITPDTVILKWEAEIHGLIEVTEKGQKATKVISGKTSFM